MNALKLTFFIALTAGTLMITSCNQQKQSADDHLKSEQQADKSGPEYTSAYICPMHCKGSGGNHHRRICLTL